jgi:putative endonuclease
MATHNDFGKQGELMAEQFLVNKGYKIIARNYRFGKGEIDLISTHQDMLIFVEVRARKDEEIIRVTDTISKKKKHLLLKTANHFVEQRDIDLECRFDVITLIGYGKPTIQHIQEAIVP